MTPSWAQIRLAALAVVVVALLSAAVALAVHNTEAIQNQRRDSIISDCRRDDMRYRNAVAELHRLAPNAPSSKLAPAIILIGALVPFHKDCEALADHKVKS